MLRFIARAAACLLAAPVFAVSTCTFTLDADDHVMLLDADCSITTPADGIVIPDGWTLDGAGHSITATGPAFAGAVVRNGGAIAHVTDLVVLGSGLTCTCHPSAPVDLRLRGIFFNGGGGSVTHSVVSDIEQAGTCGCQEGNGIEVRNLDGGPSVNVLIRDNEVRNYQKNGITVNGDAEGRVLDNVVEGDEMVGYIAQNGIQIGFGASARVAGNVVDANWYTGANWGASGILLFESSGSFVHKNVVRENQLGITIESWGWQRASASDNQVVNNDILESEWGIVIDAIDFAPFSTLDASVLRNKVSGNVIGNETAEGVAGVYVGAYTLGAETKAEITADTKIHGNAIAGFEEAIVDDGSTNLKPGGNNRPFKP